MFIIEWWAQVTVIPEVRRIAVLRRGTEYTESGVIPIGGQDSPVSIVGDSDASKKAQKKDTKKNTSDKINSNIPRRKEISSLWVWYPRSDSRETSFHQRKTT